MLILTTHRDKAGYGELCLSQWVPHCAVPPGTGYYAIQVKVWSIEMD